MVEPINKKRKLQANGSLDKQPSFADVLQQLEAEGDDEESTFNIPSPSHLDLWYRNLDADSLDSIETSAAWPRPKVLKFDKTKESIGELVDLATSMLQKLMHQPSNKSISRIIMIQNLALHYVSLA